MDEHIPGIFVMPIKTGFSRMMHIIYGDLIIGTRVHENDLEDLSTSVTFNKEDRSLLASIKSEGMIKDKATEVAVNILASARWKCPTYPAIKKATRSAPASALMVGAPVTVILSRCWGWWSEIRKGWIVGKPNPKNTLFSVVLDTPEYELIGVSQDSISLQ